MIFGIAFAPKIAERIGVVPALRLACLLAGVGSLLFAISPDVALLAVGSVIAGVGLGLVGTLGPVFGRETGGVARVGVFGASFQFGIGAGLVTGSLLADFDVGWRVGFLVSALAGVSALPLLRGTEVRHLALAHGQRLPRQGRADAARLPARGALHRDVHGAADARRLARPLPGRPGRHAPGARRRAVVSDVRGIRPAALGRSGPRRAGHLAADPARLRASARDSRSRRARVQPVLRRRRCSASC